MTIPPRISTTIIGGFLQGLRPAKRIPVSEWADKNRFLSSAASAEPGKWRTSRTPYLRDVMNQFSPYSPVQEVIVMKGAQLGLTEAGLNILGYYIDVDPCPIMSVMPTTETVRRNSKSRIQPMIDATPVLYEKIAPARKRDSGNTTFQKDFPGGTLILGGANSASSLRSAPIKVLVLDEIDGYPLDLDKEGSPIELAKARTRTFSKKKIMYFSTPTVEGSSAINELFEETDKRFYFLPCPDCGYYQHLVWQNLKYKATKTNKGKIRVKKAQYRCANCEFLIDEHHKTGMLANGEWRATAPDNADILKVGFHINSLYSPLGWYSWREAATDYEKAKGKPNKMKVFTNTVLGLTWKEKGEVPDWELLLRRTIRYDVNTVKKEICLITAGVDVQKDRLELEIVGWCPGKVSYSIDYRVIAGDTAGPVVWNELAAVVNETWTRDDGVILPMSRMGIDSGYNTSKVYDFCRRYHRTKVIPLKGQDKQPTILSQPRAVDRKNSGKSAGGLALWSVGVSVIKQEIYGFLKLKIEEGEIPKGYCFFPDSYDEHYFKMLCSEQLEKRTHKTKGYTFYEWVKIQERNEALDCRVYARAAAAAVGIDRWREKDWKHYAAQFVSRTKPAATKRRRPKDSIW